MRRKTLMVIGLTGEAPATALLAYAFSIESLPLAILAATLEVRSRPWPAWCSPCNIADFAEGSDRTRSFTLYRIGFNAGYVAVAPGGLDHAYRVCRRVAFARRSAGDGDSPGLPRTFDPYVSRGISAGASISVRAGPLPVAEAKPG